MNSTKKFKNNSLTLIIFLSILALITTGCSSSKINNDQVNPLGALHSTNKTEIKPPTNGVVTNVTKPDVPIVTTPCDNTDSGNCTNENNQNVSPDVCLLCNSTNPGPCLGATTGPIIKNVVANAQTNRIVFSWKTNKESVSKLTLKTQEGDILPFSVSKNYQTKHRYTVNGLISDTMYQYVIVCTDRHGNRSSSETFGKLYVRTLK